MGRTFTIATIATIGAIGITPGITLGIILAGITPGITSGVILDIILDILLADIVPAGILLPGMLLADIVGVVNMGSWIAHMIRQGWLRPPFAFISTGPLILIILMSDQIRSETQHGLNQGFGKVRSNRRVIDPIAANRREETDLPVGKMT